MKFFKQAFMVLLSALLLLTLAACGDGAKPFTLSADKTTAMRGEAVTFSATVDGEDAADVVYQITQGADSATLAGNVLTISSTAAAGTKIKVVAKTASQTSNEVTVTVVAGVESIVASANATNVMGGGSVVLQKEITPADAAGTVSWVIVEGQDLCAISGDVLIVNANATVGSTIKVKAVCGAVESNELTFTVGIPVTSITIEAIGSTDVVKGNTVTMTETIAPTGASSASLSWTITEGGEYATIQGKTLVVNATAPTGATIKVKATAGAVESNELTFTVKATQAEENETRYLMSFDQDRVTLDKNGTSAPVLSLTVYNYNFVSVSGLAIDYEILSGAEFLAITPNGYTCALTAKGHGTATVKATIRGTEISQTATVSVIVPPESIQLPEVFRERPGFAYSFSKVDPATQAAEQLPFAVTVLGDKVATAVKYTFVHKDGSMGDTVATYSDGKITFHKSGEITVTVSSDTGSRVETSAVYTFNINEGYNVSTFEELRLLADNAAYTGSLPINIVVLQKPDGSANGYEYGFDLVPAVALKAQAQQTFDEIATIANRIAFTNKGLILYGNGHKLDASQVRIATADEVTEHKAQGGSWERQSYVLGIHPWSDDPNYRDHKTYSVSIYDFEVVGNCPINPGLNTASPVGIYQIGIQIGRYEDGATADYYVDMENVNASAAVVGIRLLHTMGKVKNTTVNNCFCNGMEIGGSILTLENMVYGACGATGIELVPQYCDKAGVNRNQNQQVTYAGTVTTQFYNNGATEYLINYKVAGQYTVPDILGASFAASELNDHQLLHLNDGQGFVFVTFMFHDLGVAANTSQVIYPGFQAGGIINARNLPKDGTFDTTHEYIELYVGIPGVDAGKAYLYNVKYQPQ